MLSLLLVAGVLAAPAAQADARDIVDAVRAAGCDGAAGLSRPLRRSPALDDVARRWSRGGRLAAALREAERGGYRAQDAASIHVTATRTELLARILEQRYCATLLRPDLVDLGVHQRGDDVWFVLARPQALPASEDASAMAERVLELVNRARATPRRCGQQAFDAAPALRPSPRLTAAALGHARDMARNSLFDHQGSDGSSAAVRVSRAGYTWKSVAENIAAGVTDPAEVVAGWLESPGHCANIMSPGFQDMGVAFAVDTRSRDGIYWAQVLASPR